MEKCSFMLHGHWHFQVLYKNRTFFEVTTTNVVTRFFTSNYNGSRKLKPLPTEKRKLSWIRWKNNKKICRNSRKILFINRER